MRSLLSKITATAVALFMVLGFLAVPSAVAQDEGQGYAPGDTGAVNCAGLPAPTIEIDEVALDVVVTLAQGSLTCVVNVLIEINPIIYDGPPPVSGVLRVALPALPTGPHSATVTVTDRLGNVKSDTVVISAAALAALAAKLGVPAIDAANPAVPAAPAVVVPQNLAFTGGDLNLPLTAGAVLVGAGGLVLLAARKRELSA